MNGESLTDEQLGELEKLEHNVKCDKEHDEDRASGERNKKRVDLTVAATVIIGMTTIVPPILKKILKIL